MADLPDIEWVTGRVTLRIGNAPLDLEMTVPARPVKPHRMLPIFHQMADSFADIGIRATAETGQAVSCKSKCSACCNQAVPIAEAELYYIADLVNEMPEPRRTEIRARFAHSIEHFRSAGWFSELRRGKGRSWEGAEQLVLEYFQEGVPCPFLEDSMCSIYANRPIACREYLATSDPKNCLSPTAEGVKLVDLPIKTSVSLKKLAAGEASRHEGLFIILIMALEIAEKYPESFPEKTGEQWMADFFRILTSEEPSSKPRPDPAPNLRKRRSRHKAKR